MGKFPDSFTGNNTDDTGENTPDFTSRLMSFIPGGQYLTPQQQEGAFGLSLLNAGVGMLAANSPRAGYTPSLGAALAAGAQGFGQGLSQAGQEGLGQMYYGAQIGAHNMSALKSQMEAVQNFSKLLAQARVTSALSAGKEPNQADLVLLNPDKYSSEQIETQAAPKKALAQKGMQVGEDGRAQYIPGMAEEEARAAGMKESAQAPYKPIVVPGIGAMLPQPLQAATGIGGGAGAGTMPVPQSPNPAYGTLINSAASNYNLDPAVLSRMAQVESGWDASATSPKGAKGVMQIMPATAAGYGVKAEDLSDPATNIYTGARYLKDMMTKYGGNQQLALMAYNWGPDSVDKWLQDGARPEQIPVETRNYVGKILGGPSQQTATPVAGLSVQPGPGGSVILGSQQTAQPGYIEDIGKRAVDDFYKDKESAVSAAKALGYLQAARNAYDSGMITGAGADWRLGLAKIGNLLGVDNGDVIANTEAFRSNLANVVLPALKMTGSGSGISDTDREYVEKAAAGQISLDGKTIPRIMDISTRAMNHIVGSYNRKAQAVEAHPSWKGMPFGLQVEVPTFSPATAGIPATKPSTANLKAKYGLE